jgi:hypothetical protein
LILRFLKAVRIKEKAAAEAEEKRRVDSILEDGLLREKPHLSWLKRVRRVEHPGPW